MGGGIGSSFYYTQPFRSCEELIIRTQLFSPDPEVLADLKEGDILDIALLAPSGPCIALWKGRVTGTIINKELIQLIDCLNKGVQFIAIVRRVIMGLCSITIKAK